MYANMWVCVCVCVLAVNWLCDGVGDGAEAGPGVHSIDQFGSALTQLYKLGQ